jgi:hypothetical protein
MPTIQLQVDQTDNGLNLAITDATVWADSANTGVTAVSITLTYNSIVYTVVTESPTQPCAASSLTWSIPSTDVGFGTAQTFTDGLYTIIATYTTSPASDPINSQIFLDWNAKYYDLQQVKNLPYKLDNNQFTFNTQVEQNMVFNTLLRGAQYNAAVGQTTKVTDILVIIENFKLKI